MKLRLSADWTWACSCDCHPELWDRDPKRTCGTSSGAAARAELLARRYPGRLTFSIGSELTLFMRGIVPDSTFTTRLRNPALPSRKPTAFGPCQHSSPGSFAYAWSALRGHHLPVIPTRTDGLLRN